LLFLKAKRAGYNKALHTKHNPLSPNKHHPHLTHHKPLLHLFPYRMQNALRFGEVWGSPQVRRNKGEKIRRTKGTNTKAKKRDEIIRKEQH
jgi:hypothetical protein